MSHSDPRFLIRLTRGVFCSVWKFAAGVCVVAGTASGQEYYYDSYQITNQHRFQPGGNGIYSGWGHHLGHMVRTATQGLWYVDDTGGDVWVNPNINYHRFDGTKWVLMRTLANPAIIQQNTASLAIGDTIYTYGLNTAAGGYLEEAVCNTRTNSAVYNRKIRFTGYGTNYIGAAVSPGGTRVVWWTRVVNPNGPSDWVYMYNSGSGWSNNIVSQLVGADFSYVFASFLNDTTFYVGGEVPRGYGPYTFQVAAAKVVLGHPFEGFTKMKGDNVAPHDIWVNKANGDVHMLTYGAYGGFGYFYKPAGGAWTDTVTLDDNLGASSRCRFIDSPDGSLYLIVSAAGFKLMTIPKASITGKINFAGRRIDSLGSIKGFDGSYAIWPECREFQTTPVGGINFAYPGNDWAYPTILRHTSVKLNPGAIGLRLSLPNGLETFQQNQSQPIYWYRLPSAGIDSVKIEFSSNGGSVWSTVAAAAPNTGSYTWQVPALISPTCRIRISNVVGGSPSDTSDANFSIVYVPVSLKPPVATIRRPSQDTIVIAGAKVTFEGTGSDTDGYIVNYVWTTGDGRVNRGIVTRFDHIYASPGIYYATFEVQDNDTLWSPVESVKITVQPSTAVSDEPTAPLRLQLFPTYPNPFNAGTVISYSIDKTMHVRLRIFGVRGEEIARLVDGIQLPGLYRFAWDARATSGRTLCSGWYACRLETATGSRVQKILLLR